MTEVEIEAPPLEAGLYVVATPIGNLRDITIRALETLAAADIIACEDTRVTGKLTRHYGIRTRLLAYHDHNAGRRRPQLLKAIAAGDVVALVSDAGTPLVSDPGYRLVAEAIEGGEEIIPVPGPSALLAALSASGLPTNTFLFAGFPPAKSSARRKRLQQLSRIPSTLIFFEGPSRAAESLTDMAEILGGTRAAAFARELTKRFEEFRRGSLAELAAAIEGSATPKGEVTILVGPPELEDVSEAVFNEALRDGLARLSLADAVAEVAADYGLPRNRVYRQALAMKDHDEK